MTYMEYLDLDTVHTLAGIFMVGVTLFGFHVSLKIRRPAIFRFKLAFVYLLPLSLAVTYLVPTVHIAHPYRVLLMCAFMIFTSALYWREVRDLTTKIGYQKKALPDFLDLSPDMIWMKDLNNKFTYTNEAIRDGLLKCTEAEAFGKTGVELAIAQREKGHTYTFGEVCGDSDSITLKNRKVSRFLEFGTVNGQFLALQVFKAPLYNTRLDGSKYIIGTIGIGRDLTYDFLDHEKISKLIDEGDVKKALKVFDRHKRRYMFTGTDIIRADGKSEFTHTPKELAE